MPKQYLRGCIPECSTIGSCPELLILMKHFREPKIDKLDISFFVYHHVLWLYVPVYNIILCQSLESAKDL